MALRAVVDALVHGLGPVCCGMVSHVVLLLPRGRESARPQHRPLLLRRISAVRTVQWFRRDGSARPCTAAGAPPGPPCPENQAASLGGPEIGRAHVGTPVTNAQIVCSLLFE